ncbi:probable CCR4-associated factor 1 homolog 6 [Macadamia integrifolia]|uniref:probable CCR4-associated factor 1 homolog 6 n=1 Tax=Macadamia integrifolia TaxID=60698 RepID=UPI001C4F7F83|nr:probable CCR4-associated factor 1 homolog 6 [Macadamia integrifolia]
MELLIRNVWRSNFEEEMLSIESIVHIYNRVAFDPEFLGFLRNTQRNASETDRYEDIKFNVDSLKPIQFGLTFTDAEGNLPHSGGVWQFNFNDFDPVIDLHLATSVELLLQNGIDLEKNKREGFDIKAFSARFRNIIRCEGHRIQWLTFHGVYDIAYFIKFCHGLLGGELGLTRLAKILEVKQVGETHQGGFDSLITSNVYSKIKNVYQLIEGAYEGYLYGINFRKKKWVPLVPPHPHFITVVLNGYYHEQPSFEIVSSPLRWPPCHALVPTVQVPHCQ